MINSKSRKIEGLESKNNSVNLQKRVREVADIIRKRIVAKLIDNKNKFMNERRFFMKMNKRKYGKPMSSNSSETIVSISFDDIEVELEDSEILKKKVRKALG